MTTSALDSGAIPAEALAKAAEDLDRVAVGDIAIATRHNIPRLGIETKLTNYSETK
jgi:hypothetical protein